MSITIVVEDCLGCCAQCHDLWGDELDVVISGYSGCGCVLGGGGTSFQETSHTGITGNYTATWDGTLWRVIVGTITIQAYSDASCSVATTSDVYDVELTINCSDNLLTVSINILTPPAGSGNIFTHTPAGELDEVLDNTVVCPGTTFAAVDTVTVSLP